MKRLFLNRGHRHLIVGAMFVALLFQSLIPAGFMPASDGSFALQVCHSGLPTHSGGHSHVEFCSFGALPGAGPITHVAAFLPSRIITPQSVADVGLPRPAARFERAHPPRGPPESPLLS
jgi:hypothetical protein